MEIDLKLAIIIYKRGDLAKLERREKRDGSRYFTRRENYADIYKERFGSFDTF